ncbi:MAG TPA: hypothetical protein VKC66_22220 [Xanthobacteraceae bacterium]|nr:hypothetical protein [Xanthobacteraceae bacterium]
MWAVSSRAEYAAVKCRRDVRTGSMTYDDVCAGSMPSNEVSSSDVSATRVPTSEVRTTTEVPATAMTAAVFTAMSRGSLCRKRQATKRENCGQREN